MKDTDHTYAAHVIFPAISDEDARARIKTIFDMLGGGRIVAQYMKPEIEVLAIYGSDADDWSEQIDLVEGLCPECGGPATDRVRDGSGSRKCYEHRRREYAIRDAAI
jgi:hypothetical protein